MLKTAFQFTTLLSLIIFLLLMGSGVMWQIALMRTGIAYMVLMIIFYLSILLITIASGKRFILDNNKREESPKTE